MRLRSTNIEIGTAATLAAVLAWITAAAPASAGECQGVANVRATATALVDLGPRPDGSAAGAEAAEFIASRLRSLGHEPRRQAIGSVAVPRIAVGPWQIRPAEQVTSAQENLWVRFGGDGPARLFVAHYDTVPSSPGAVDNATSVAILLELASCLAAELPPGPVIVAFTGAEEIGLVGARRLAQTIDGQLEMAISLDLIGHQRALAINGASSEWTLERLEWLAERTKAADVDAYVPLFHRVVSRKFPQLERSDHGAFASLGVPAIHLYGRGAERIYLPYHGHTDDMSQVRDDALAAALALTVALSRGYQALPAKSDDIGMWLASPLGPLVVSGWAAFGVEIVVAIAAFVMIVMSLRSRRRAVRERAIGVLAALLVFVGAFLAVAIANQAASMVNGNPLAAAHDPFRFVAASLAIAAATGGLLTMLATRWAYFVRGSRYHAYAAAIELAVGVALLALGAIELAWLPLGAALLFAIGGTALERPIISSVSTAAGVALAVALLVAPNFLREAIFHGFYPPMLPLAAYLAVVSLPSWLAAFGALRARLGAPERGVTIALVLALVGAIGVAVAVLVIPEPACADDATRAYGLACELSATFRP